LQWGRRTTRARLRNAVIALCIVQSLACERSAPAAGRKDTVVPVTPPPESTVVPVPGVSAGDHTAGPALFVAGATQQDAFVIVPRYTDVAALDSIQFDPAPLQALRVELFGSG